jgi:hypothetical protein
MYFDLNDLDVYQKRKLESRLINNSHLENNCWIYNVKHRLSVEKKLVIKII